MIKKHLLKTLFLIPLTANNHLSTKETQKKSFQQSKPKNEQTSLVKPLLLLAGSIVIVVGGIWWYNRSYEEVQGDKVLEKLIKNINKKKIRQDVIIPKNSVLTQYPNNIKATEYNYSNPNLFDILCVQSDDILLVNGANPGISFWGGGTNKALSKLVTALTGEKRWGVIKNLQGEARQGKTLKVGGIGISTTKVPNKPTIHVMHILGPNSDNRPKTQKDLKKAMRIAVSYALEKKKDIMLCPVSTGLYSNGEQMTNDMYKVGWEGVEEAVQLYKDYKPNKDLPINIYFNMYHRHVIQHIPNKHKYDL